jgi:hypothetical protein
MKEIVMDNSNPIWWHIQDGGLDIFNALLQYGYHFKGLVMNNSKTKTLDDNAILLFYVTVNPTWGTSKMAD